MKSNEINRKLLKFKESNEIGKIKPYLPIKIIKNCTYQMRIMLL